jgi:hypothetical protein
MRYITGIILFLLAIVLGGWLSFYFLNNPGKEITNVESSVLLEKVEKVCKLVTVEGNFVELYDEENIRNFTIYLPLPSTWSFSKEATLEVRGKVIVGFDMENIKITADSTNKIIQLSNLPAPEILSIDHEVKYKDLEESFFNAFTPEDYTRLNRNAKEVLRKKAEESRLLEEAVPQGNQMLDVIRFMAEGFGWTLILESAEKEVLPN